MPKIRLVRGLKSYRSKGRLYHYHRATGVRINIDPEVDPEAFLARARELDGAAAVLRRGTSSSVEVVSLGDLLDAWKKSQEWQALKSETQGSYQRVIDPTTGAISSKRTISLTSFTPSIIASIRDEVAQKRKRWMANYSVKVLRTAFGWGRLRGWCQSNAAEGVPLLPRPSDAAVRNRAWSPEEFEIVWDRASPRLRRALALAYYAGLRLGDVVSVPWTAWDGIRCARPTSPTVLPQRSQAWTNNGSASSDCERSISIHSTTTCGRRLNRRISSFPHAM